MTPASRDPTAAVAFLALLDTTRRREGGMVWCASTVTVCSVVRVNTRSRTWVTINRKYAPKKTTERKLGGYQEH